MDKLVIVAGWVKADSGAPVALFGRDRLCAIAKGGSEFVLKTCTRHLPVDNEE